MYVCMYVCIYVCIYYYTPLPLNLANKQASNKEATNTLFWAQFWEGTSRFGATAPERHRRFFGSKLGFGKGTT